uniref:type I-F CRISPR-associated protein Csy2 n=1 Tax=Providencia sp. PROV265 TaxID=2949953 RepID=UPI00234A997A|nr:type I-F CRISPR-associated protein Csy2 [Providencia sp. PROV265]
MSLTYILKLPHIKIQNANALSSPYTIGFPAMTAWLGFMHALERKLRADGHLDIVFDSIAVISHGCDLQTYRGPNDYVNSIVGTANPLNSDGTRSAFIEEARCHLDVSLLIRYGVNDGGKTKALPTQSPILEVIYDLIQTMKLAGGDILSLGKPTAHILQSDEVDGESRQGLLNSVMPGYALIERRDLMIRAMEDGQDAMDALLDYVVVENNCVEWGNENEGKSQFEWRAQRKVAGWVVPIATGYQGVSPLAQAKNQRDLDVPHRFAESVVTLGEFILANRANNINEILWQYGYDEPNNLYLCQQVASKFISSGE